jgi:serine/threonine protein kinase
MNEITVLSNVAHPNIVAYYGSFVEDNILNVVMEYADNGGEVRINRSTYQAKPFYLSSETVLPIK